MANILGLISSESFAAERFKNVRRSVFYFYPNGAAPLTGLLSLMKEEKTNDPEFKWFEKRMIEQWTATVAISTTVPWYSTGITVAAGKVTAATTAIADITFTAGTQYAVKGGADVQEKFRIGHIIRIRATDTGGNFQEVMGHVNAVNGTGDTPANVLGFIAIRTVTTAVDFDLAGNIGAQILVAGSAFKEGSLDVSSGIYNTPIEPYNYTQIFRTPFSITGTALKTSARYDETGVYKDMAKENSIYHTIELEKAFMFGERRQSTVNGEITRYTDGILGYLRKWESGSVYGNTAATLDTDDNKRIITNSSGTMTETVFDGYLERLFRVTNNKANEKLALCGSGFLSVINRLYKNKTTMTADLPLKDTYGMNVVKQETPFGTIYWKTHPLFSQNPVLRNNALFVDVQNLKYRYLDGRDTELLKNRQANDADFRKDEWLTECGLETNFPESHMYIQNVQSIT